MGGGYLPPNAGGAGSVQGPLTALPTFPIGAEVLSHVFDMQEGPAPQCRYTLCIEKWVWSDVLLAATIGPIFFIFSTLMLFTSVILYFFPPPEAQTPSHRQTTHTRDVAGSVRDMCLP